MRRQSSTDQLDVLATKFAKWQGSPRETRGRRQTTITKRQVRRAYGDAHTYLLSIQDAMNQAIAEPARSALGDVQLREIYASVMTEMCKEDE